MGRKRKLDVGADGTLSTGIYDVPPPAESLSDKAAEEWIRCVFRQINATPKQVMASLRSEFLCIIKPHIEGPVSAAEVANAPGRTTLVAMDARGITAEPGLTGTQYRSFDFGDGDAVYRLAPYLLLHHNSEWAREEALKAFGGLDDKGRVRALRALDAMGGLDDIRKIEDRLCTWPPSLPQIDDALIATLRLGMICERLAIREFEPVVAGSKALAAGRHKAAEKTNERRREEAIARVARVKELQAEGFRKTAAVETAAEEFDVETATIWNNLKAATKKR